MEAWSVWIVLAVETVVAGGFTIIIPKITRRGLLFGVYVGEQHWASVQARAIAREWYAGMILGVAASIVLGAGLALGYPTQPLAVVSSLLMVLTFTVVCYLRAHFRARRLAVAGAPVSAAALIVDAPAALTVPIVATSIGALCGAAALGYAWMHYADMPAMVPTHFGISGRPDAWAPRSFGSVMMLPLMAAVLSPGMGLMACLTARAKRAIRQADGGVSLAAQLRFRRAVTVFLSGTVILVSLLLTSMSIAATRVALGLSEGLPGASMALTGVLLLYAIGGSLYLMLHFGQGGARLEKAAGSAPLTNGLADNAHWVLGVVYVNRDDPSFLVEKRFGVGYTVNLGNPRAALLVILFVLFMIGVVWFARSTPHTSLTPGS